MKSEDFNNGKNIHDFDLWLEVLKIQRPDIYEVIENELFSMKKVEAFTD